jgi:hypothetical protein
VMAATTAMETTTDAMTVTTIAMMEIEVGTTTVDGLMTMATVMSLTCHHSTWQRVRTRWVLATRTRTRQVKTLPVGIPAKADG